MNKYNGLNKFGIFLKYHTYNYIVNPFGKILFYFMAFLNSVYLKGTDLFLAIIVFIPTILFIECIITILINPEFNSKQKESLNKIFGITAFFFAIPFIASLFQIFPLIPISSTFILIGFVYKLGAISEKIDNYTHKAGNILLMGLIICFSISFVSFRKINDPFLINFFLFLSISILLIRIIDFFPRLHFSLEVDTEEYVKKHKTFKDKLIRVKKGIFHKYSSSIIVDKAIYLDNSIIRNDKGNVVKNKKKISTIKKLIEYKKKLVSIKEENKRKLLLRLILFPLSFPLFIFLNNKITLLQQSKWFYKNYNNIPDFGLKTREDRELHRKDAEMNIGFEILEEKIHNINILVNMYFDIPSDILFDLIQNKVKDSLKYAKQDLAPILDRRLELARIDIRKRYGNKATRELIEKLMKRKLYNVTSEHLRKTINSLEKYNSIH